MEYTRSKVRILVFCILNLLWIPCSLPAGSDPALPLYKMTIYPTYFELHSGEETILELTVENTGEKPLHNLAFIIQPDTGMSILCDPSSVPGLNRGESVKIKLKVNPESAIFQKSIKIPFVVRCDGYQKEEFIQFQVFAMEGFWMITGFIMTFLLVIFFIFIFIRMGNDKSNLREAGNDRKGA